jgi:hypothetical protein
MRPIFITNHENRPYNRGAQIQGLVLQVITHVDRELNTLHKIESKLGSQESRRELNLTFFPWIIGPGKVPAARVAL